MSFGGAKKGVEVDRRTRNENLIWEAKRSSERVPIERGQLITISDNLGCHFQAGEIGTVHNPGVGG